MATQPAPAVTSSSASPLASQVGSDPSAFKPKFEAVIVLAIAGSVGVLHILTNGRYGFHRDELQTLSDALHMDWGFVAYPPLTPFVERVSMAVFGYSMIGLRLASVIAQLLAVVVTARMAQALDGGRVAQTLAALAVAVSPLPLFEGTEFQYSSFDYLWWVLTAYFVIRLLQSDDARWCLAIGATIGVGLMTKYTTGFFLAGIVGGLLLTEARRFLLSKWFWAGVGLAFLICLPNVLWQLRHDLISLHFLEHIHKRDVGEGRADGFLVQQLWLCTTAFSVPLWVGGLVAYFRNRRLRMLGWMYVIPLALFVVGKGRSYYLAAAYPMLIAMGVAAGERWAQSWPRVWQRVVPGVLITGMLVGGAAVGAILIPVANAGPLKQFALKNNGDLREEIGWHDLVQAVAGVRDSLPAEQRASVGILVGNYGEQGALEVFGPAYQLPLPISLTNSAWLRGYPTPQPTTLIVVGWSKGQLDDNFSGCRVAGHNGNSEGVENEESRWHPDIYLCGPPRKPWPEFWKENQRFG